MISKTFSSSHHGVDGILIEVQASVQNALPQIHVTGLPGTVVKESRDRLEACFAGLGFNIPSGRVVVHLSPANAPKQGSHFDLPIALAVLAAEGRLPVSAVGKIGALGELSLDGRLRAISGAVPLIESLEKNREIETILVPRENGLDAALLNSKKVFVAGNLGECIDFIRGEKKLTVPDPTRKKIRKKEFHLTLDMIMGQWLAKRALQVALAGEHHLLFLGAPGVGKSLLAYASGDLLPALYLEEEITLHKIYGIVPNGVDFDGRRPFRSPHHSISIQGLLGGGTGVLYPGEISLAHAGILFLDEFLEFRRDAMEGLREPLQSGVVHLQRAQTHFTFPARFTCIAAMNPCPCGYSLSPDKSCRCAPEKVQLYRKRLSGPILDRMDLAVILGSPLEEAGGLPAFSHREVQGSIRRVREIRRHRGNEISWEHESLKLDAPSEEWLKERTKSRGLSLRAVHKVIRIARTVADLENQSNITKNHVMEAWDLKCPETFEPFSH